YKDTLAPYLVTKVPKDNATDWASNVTDRQNGEGQEEAKTWIKVNKIDLTEDDRRRGGEQDEVVKLDHRAQKARGKDTTHHRRVQGIREILRGNLFRLCGRRH